MAARIEDIYALQIRELDDVKGVMIESKDRVKELYEEVIDDVVNEPELVELTSTSKASIWRLWSFVTALQIWLHEWLWVQFKSVLDDAARYAQSHTAAWYREKVLQYQHGDPVTLISGAFVYDVDGTALHVENGAVGYNPILPENQIIAACSVTETIQGDLVIKAAKDDGGLVPLEQLEYNGLEAYISQFQDAGVNISLVSQNADVLKLQGVAYYAPSKTSINAFRVNVETAVNNYLRNLDFDGVFRRIQLIDELQKVEGFHDIQIDTLQASVAYTVTPIFNNINLEYETIAGYIQVDSNFPILTNVTFEAYIN